MAAESAMMGGDSSAKAVPTSDSIKAAGIIFSTLPIVMVYPFLQKIFCAGRDDRRGKRIGKDKVIGMKKSIMCIAGVLHAVFRRLRQKEKQRVRPGFSLTEALCRTRT